MTMREFISSDLRECAALFASVFNGEPWNETWDVDDAATRIGDIWASPKCVGVVSRDTVINGFVIGNMIRIEHNDIFELKEMCVSTAVQRQGVGTTLLEELYVRLVEAGADSMFLQTSHETPAFQFYLKNGFKKEPHFSALTRSLQTDKE